jgi:hypothetical protein
MLGPPKDADPVLLTTSLLEFLGSCRPSPVLEIVQLYNFSPLDGFGGGGTTLVPQIEQSLVRENSAIAVAGRTTTLNHMALYGHRDRLTSEESPEERHCARHDNCRSPLDMISVIV